MDDKKRIILIVNGVLFIISIFLIILSLIFTYLDRDSKYIFGTLGSLLLIILLIIPSYFKKKSR